MSLRLKRGAWTPDHRPEGGTNTKLHAVSDSVVRPVRFFVTAGQVSDYIGVRALCGSLPRSTGGATTPTGSAEPWTAMGYTLASLAGSLATNPVRQAAIQATQPHRNHVRLSKGLAPVAARYGRRPRIFLSALALAVAVIFWL